MKMKVTTAPPIQPPKVYHLELSEDEMECLRRFAYEATVQDNMLSPHAYDFLKTVGAAYVMVNPKLNTCFK